ncbi:SRPBCC family protein [Chryseobacterium sp. MFBS3-17]|uniref:SRPBCC family protein n=1 Tax=Chryseobacterium sp. MFBS3-17 TaxID=2886689 RepID=UPI001D0E2039|nr:SRPBCC family protein [Chryseobacterium sp. MFBS3-17]MCC2589936.1 SRPBCC family protein [Chryseobacterium sp. MFBS3-17]
MEESKITVETLVHADLDTVWKCYTDPQHITGWNFASADWHCPSVTNQLVPGGLYTARMEARDGSAGFDFQAVYDEIIDQQKIRYTMTDGREAETTFRHEGDSVAVTTIFDAEHSHPVELQQQGWQAILDQFKQYTEGIGHNR